MLELIRPYGTSVPPYLAPSTATYVAHEAWELRGYYALRREIFAREQGLFRDHDRDQYDADAVPIVAVSLVAGMRDEIVGVVRIYEASDASAQHGPGVWYGGRLGVHRRYRRQASIGAGLIRAAVTTAHARGCQRFLATVQEANLRYFMSHHFAPIERVTVCGVGHYLMTADLRYFPPDRSALAVASATTHRRRART